MILWLVFYFGGREDYFDDRSGFGDYMFWRGVFGLGFFFFCIVISFIVFIFISFK